MPRLWGLCPPPRAGSEDSGRRCRSRFASMRHILHLHPGALGAAMVDFARQIQAELVAEGMESEAELAAVTGLSMYSGQGYVLGRPSAEPREWATREALQGRDMQTSRTIRCEGWAEAGAETPEEIFTTCAAWNGPVELVSQGFPLEETERLEQTGRPRIAPVVALKGLKRGKWREDMSTD